MMSKFVQLNWVVLLMMVIGGCAKPAGEPTETYKKWAAGPRYKVGRPTVTDGKKILVLYQLMKDFHEVMAKHHVLYWAEWGTLIGALRHDGIIPWDDDVDVALYPGEELKFLALKREFEALGYYVGKAGFGYKVALSVDDYIDVFLMEMKEDRLYYTGWHQGRRETDPKLFYRKSEILPLKLHKFGEFEVFVPNDPKEQISWWAGENWMDLGVQTHSHSGPVEEVKFDLTHEDRNPAQPTGPLLDRVR